MAKVTIKDIARALGVAPSTVTRALAGSSRISAETVRRVRQTAEAMGYVADSAARAMRSGRSALVGLLIPDIQNHFYATMARTVARSCQARGHQLVLSMTEDDPAIEEQHVRALAGARCAGVLLVPTVGPTPDTRRLLSGLSVVQLIRRQADLAADGFGIDDEGAIHSATGYLLDLGHRRIGFVCGHGSLDTAVARRAGYERALRERGIDLDPGLVEAGEPRVAHGREAVGRLMALTEAPSALLAGGAALTEGLLDGVSARAGGRASDLAVVGFGDAAALRWWPGGGLTTVALPIDQVADAGCRRLFEGIDQGRTAPDTPAFVRFETSMVLRGSARAPR